MTYETALSYINKAQKLGSLPGLTRMKKILEYLGNPQDKCKTIHVAGTNGKGSTTTMIANALIHAGYKVGKFMSPYVYEYGERICINNEMITPEEIVGYIEKIKQVTDLPEFEKLQPTEFEVNTLIAFLHYEQNSCDYVVLEVGLGGRLDATNVLSETLLCVITSISLDHTHILGDNVLDIASEKCGIINDCPVVCYPLQETGVIDVFRSFADDLVIPKLQTVRVISADIYGSKFTYDGTEFTVKLCGEHQVYNAVTVIKACKKLALLGVNITDDDINFALNNTKINARMEILCEDPLVIVDGSHNASGIEFLCLNANNLLGRKKKCAIFGMLEDKDNDEAIKYLEETFDTVIFTTVDYYRAIDSKKLAQKSKKDEVFVTNSVEEALEIAKKHCFDATFVCGSLYLAKNARNYFTSKNK